MFESQFLFFLDNSIFLVLVLLKASSWFFFKSSCYIHIFMLPFIIIISKNNIYIFLGEIRVNEQLVLTVMHTLMAREHNRVARELAAVNPHWDDETLFQEARRINIAIIQHITYNEFLPILLGKDVMEKFGLLLEKEVNVFGKLSGGY